jgi:hypothetical protein
MNKNHYCHNFKTRFGHHPGSRPSLQVGLTIDLDQSKDESGYYHSFKTNSRVNMLRGSTWVDSGQHKIKMVYYDSLKT